MFLKINRLHRKEKELLSREAIFDVIFVKIFQPQDVKSKEDLKKFLKESVILLRKISDPRYRAPQGHRILVSGKIEFSFYTHPYPESGSGVPYDPSRIVARETSIAEIRKKLWDPSTKYVGHRIEHKDNYKGGWNTPDFDLDLNTLRVGMVERFGRMVLKQFADESSKESGHLNILLAWGLIGFSKDCKFYVKEKELFQTIECYFENSGIEDIDEESEQFLYMVEPLAENSPGTLVQYLNSIINSLQNQTEDIFGRSLKDLVNFFAPHKNGDSKLFFMDARTPVENNRILNLLREPSLTRTPLTLPQASQSENCQTLGLQDIPFSSLGSAISLLNYVYPYPIPKEEMLNSLLHDTPMSDGNRITPKLVATILNFNYYIICNVHLFKIASERKFYVGLFEMFAPGKPETDKLFKIVIENSSAFRLFCERNKNRPEINGISGNFKLFIQKFAEVISAPNSFYKFYQDYGICTNLQGSDALEDFRKFFESDPTPDKEISKILVSDDIGNLVTQYGEAIYSEYEGVLHLTTERRGDYSKEDIVWDRLIIIFHKAISEYKKSQSAGQPKSLTLDFLRHLHQISYKIGKCLEHCWIKSLWIEDLYAIYLKSPDNTKLAFSEKIISLLFQITYPNQETARIKDRAMVFMELLESNPEIFWLFHNNANAWRVSIHEFSCAPKFEGGVLDGRGNLYSDDSYGFNFLAFLDRGSEAIKKVFEKRKQISALLDSEYKAKGYANFDEVIKKLGLDNDAANSDKMDVAPTTTVFTSSSSQKEERSQN